MTTPGLNFQQVTKAAFDEADRVVRHLGVDFGAGDSWAVMEYSVDADGNFQVRHITQSELFGQDCGNQYTGGQDF